MRVFREYKDNFTLDYTFIHHVYDDNSEILKLISFNTASTFLEKGVCMTKITQLPNFRETILDELDATFSKKDLLDVCFRVHLKIDESDVGTVKHCSYICNSKDNLVRLREMLVKETIQRICKSLGLAVQRTVKSHRDDLFQTRFSYTIPSETYAAIAKTGILNHVPCDFFGFESQLPSESLPLQIDVNTVEWRTEVAGTLLNMIEEKKDDIVDTIVENCTNTEETLKDVSTLLTDFTEKHRPIQLIKMVNEWKKREIFEKGDELNNFPSVLKVLVGQKGNKNCVKVFFEEKNEKAEILLKKLSGKLSLSGETIYEFINVNEELERKREEVNEIRKREETAPSIPSAVQQALGEYIDSNAEKIYAKYSNVIGIDVSNVLTKDHKETPCIVLYCLDKTIIPFGEKELPCMLQEFPCDIREDIMMFGSCDLCIENTLSSGCNIGSRYFGGSAGFMFNSPFRGFLTAAHVAAENVGKIYKTEEKDLSCIGGLREEIVHPFRSPVIVGEVEKCILGNFNNDGLDVAIVRMKNPNEPDSRQQLQIAENESLIKGVRVVKRGCATGVTEGIFGGVLSSCRIDPKVSSGRFYHFNNCFGILDKGGSQFFKMGDSGSGVFQIDETDRSLYPIGIAFGRLNNGRKTCVCKIKDIAKKFNLSICQDAFSYNMLRDIHDEENMDIN